MPMENQKKVSRSLVKQGNYDTRLTGTSSARFAVSNYLQRTTVYFKKRCSLSIKRLSFSLLNKTIFLRHFHVVLYTNKILANFDNYLIFLSC